MRQIRAWHTADTVRVYQAYSPSIAIPALEAGRFVPPFKRDRMTWVKPSFLWMMYRSGWATKPGQETVLAVELTRAGFDWAVAAACPSSYQHGEFAGRQEWAERLHASPVRVQWDPERDLHLQPLPYRSLQLGLSGAAVDRYVDEWTVSITDVTGTAHRIRALLRAGETDAAAALLPSEPVYG
ncbi:DUF4291 domain-containing protein [Dactylosporangium sp. AC04546]|uniref:DUF4291 domain-containing protein n=1 Tax=Dactylosporangium sp. AC04546 TaxID=2862460 RepID=UPI001EDF1D8F|nr:DUF4291 domain-containing protein [Dactylosporangium sp. AC04546]WVK89603.1 DUF4291 domain-containing protein [Dactylosporangium sp. AC04546]